MDVKPCTSLLAPAQPCRFCPFVCYCAQLEGIIAGWIPVKFEIIKSNLEKIEDPFEHFARLACILFYRDILEGTQPSDHGDNYKKIFRAMQYTAMSKNLIELPSMIACMDTMKQLAYVLNCKLNSFNCRTVLPVEFFVLEAFSIPFVPMDPALMERPTSEKASESRPISPEDENIEVDIPHEAVDVPQAVVDVPQAAVDTNVSDERSNASMEDEAVGDETVQEPAPKAKNDGRNGRKARKTTATIKKTISKAENGRSAQPLRNSQRIGNAIVCVRDGCGMHFSSRQEMHDHVNIYHQNEQSYECPHCDHKCSREYNLRCHITSFHQENSLRSTSKAAMKGSR